MTTKEAAVLLEEEETVGATAHKSKQLVSSSSAPSGHRLKVLTYASALLGNSTSAVVTNPFDIIKVRQQLALSSRHNFWTLGREMVVGEGVQSLWYGVTASILREASYGTIRMGSYETFKELYAPLLGPSLPFLQKLLAGVTSGALGALIASPCDLVKVQMQASRSASVAGAPPYRNTFAAFTTIYGKGGLRALWRGVGPTTLRAAVLTSTQVGTYDEAKQRIKKFSSNSAPNFLSTQLSQEGLPLHFASSMIAGFIASATSQPIDVLKVRLMNERAGSGSAQGKRTNSWSVLSSLLRNEGALGLYKGFGMCWMRLGAHTVVSLVLFERFRALFGIKPI